MVRMVATSYPGDNGTQSPTVATIGEILKQHGYLTAYFGKSHEVPPWEVSVSGPFDRWPARTGFDKSYGYIGGEQSSLSPQLIDGTTRLPIPRDPNYHFNTDMTNKAIAWMQATCSLTPDRPFLMYYASSGGHPPHTPPNAWLDRDLYKGEKRRHSTHEVVGNRSIYHDGWLAAVVHVEPWYQEPRVKDFVQDTWELYNMQEDWVIVIFGEIRRSRGVARYDKRLCPMNSRH